MGCDIHFYTEKKVDGAWTPADHWEQNEYAGEEGEPAVRVPYEKAFYTGRNYNLFAILAGVRNGRGFAGIDTGDGVVPIDDPRGLPDDVTAPVKADAERWGIDGHSHSWLTLAELLQYDWTQTTRQRGFLSAHEFWRWSRGDRERGESPESYCGDVSGGITRKVTETEMKALLQPYGLEWNAEDRIKAELASVYCRCEWEQPYYKTARHFWSDTIPKLLRLGKPEDVRIVFWFDN